MHGAVRGDIAPITLSRWRHGFGQESAPYAPRPVLKRMAGDYAGWDRQLQFMGPGGLDGSAATDSIPAPPPPGRAAGQTGNRGEVAGARESPLIIARALGTLAPGFCRT